MLILGDEPRAGNDLQQLGQLRRVLHIQFARAVAVNGLGGHRGKGLDGVVAAAVGTHQHHQQRKWQCRDRDHALQRIQARQGDVLEAEFLGVLVDRPRAAIRPRLVEQRQARPNIVTAPAGEDGRHLLT
ncbi:hypothetical protein G6F50_017535 [Rhizopus delemar]|uniref:Uncharacterized protein n=1 Tax=Rhizopus delemar TaxID=936053 RepID=A0A9P6XQ52_9FUNG|nr:hypothetical protein G6F50_017535 [Rhizopus delemar]